MEAGSRAACRLLRWLMTALLVAAAIAPEPALAATASLAEESVEGNRYVMLIYTAAAGERNNVRLTATRSAFRLTDAVPVSAGAGCVADGPTAVSCAVADR